MPPKTKANQQLDPASLSVKRVLIKRGPCLVSDAIAELRHQTGISQDAARKRIQRSRGIKYLKHIRFENNARFIYLGPQEFTELFFRNLKIAFRKSGRAYWDTLAVLEARGGICPASIFPRISGAPSKRKGHLSSEVIFKGLSEVRLLKVARYNQIPFIHLHSITPQDEHIIKMLANDSAERIALDALERWAAILGFGSYRSYRSRPRNQRTRAKQPEVSGLLWDLTAPSYLHPFQRFNRMTKKVNAGFLVADINLNGEVQFSEAEAFVRKCGLAKHVTPKSPVLPLFLAKKFHGKAFRALKEKGVLALTLRNLFGMEFSEELHRLQAMLSMQQVDNEDSSAALSDTITALRQKLRRYGNLQGACFEMAVALLIANLFPGDVARGIQLYRPDGRQLTDVDVLLAPPSGPVRAIECKSRRLELGPIPDKVVRKWHDKVPQVMSALHVLYGMTPHDIQFEMWTNAVFEDVTLQRLRSPKVSCGSALTPHSVRLVDGNEIRQMLHECTDEHVRKVMIENYVHLHKPV